MIELVIEETNPTQKINSRAIMSSISKTTGHAFDFFDLCINPF
jgi:hypothetical protein